MRYLLLLLLMAFPAVGCKKKQPPVAAATVPAAPAPEPVDERNTNFDPKASTLGNVRQAARRTVTLNEMRNLGIFVFALELQNGKMPTPAEIKADLAGNPDAKPIVAAIEEGAIVLTGTRKAGALWAYEVDANKAGGIVLIGPNGTPQRATADEVKAYLQQI